MSADRRQRTDVSGKKTEGKGQRDMLGSWKAWMVKPKKKFRR
jgi:hypothetical protein